MEGSFPHEYIPTADFEHWPYWETVDNCDYSFTLSEAPGRDYHEDCEIKDTNLDSFLAILEYLYTDHAPIEELDPVDIMVLADRFCLPRLVTLCELYIAKNVDRMIQKKVTDAVEYVVNLLLLSQAHNANQLSDWCLHFIATNYSVFESSSVFSLLQDGNKQYVEEHRWPPLSYLRELEQYQNLPLLG
ncbi:hypothetical protein QZH41_005808 [Actinostola sp. cb2023]|nr:hypothetical protein QZH41_005808 [Actinostola sp. cb2023]